MKDLTVENEFYSKMKKMYFIIDPEIFFIKIRSSSY